MNEKNKTSLLYKRAIPYIPVALTIFVGVTLSVVTFAVALRWEEHAIQDDFKHHRKEHISALKRGIDSNLLIVKSLGGLYKASHKVERQEFREFVKPFLLSYPGIQALEWIPRVPDSQRAVYEEGARQDGFPDFQITERQAQGKMVRAAQHKEYFPVYFVEPYEGNELALGFDLASNPTRLEALNRSRDTGEMVATARITLVQETGNQFGFLVFLPVYQRGSPTDPIDQRRENLEGFVLGVFRIGDIVEKALTYLESEGIGIYLYDQSAPVAKRLLYFHSSRTQKRPAAASGDMEIDLRSGPYHAETLDVVGRKWSMLCVPTSEFIAASKTWQPWGVLSFGLLLTGLLAAYFLVNIGRTAKLAKINKELQHEISERKSGEEALKGSEEKYRTLFENASEAIYVTQDGKIKFLNPKTEELYGYSAEELTSKPFTYFIHEKDRNMVLERYKRRLRGEVLPSTYTFRIINKAGDTKWVRINVVAFSWDDRPATLSFVTDVTEWKEAEETLRERTHDLGERVKELNCLYGISGLVERLDISLEKILQGTADLIPPSWQYPEITCARVILDGHIFTTKNFKETIWKQANDITVDGDRVGSVEVYYLEEKPEIDEGPFLKEERKLIEAIAERLGKIVERKRMEKALRQSKRNLAIRNKIAQILLTASDEEIYGKVLQVILQAMESKYGVFGYIDENGALVVPSMTRAIWDKCEVHDKDIRFPRDTWGDSTWPRAIREKRTIYSNEPSTKVPDGHISIRRHISLPILYQGESIGVFQVANKEKDYEKKDLELLESIASYVAPVLYARLQRDRHDRKRKGAEEALQKSEERYRTILDSIGDGYFEIDPKGNITYFNEALRKMLGYSENEFMGLNYREYTSPDTAERLYQTFNKVYETGKSEKALEYEVYTKDRTKRFVWISASLLRASGGQPIGLRGVVRDFTDRKILESQLTQAQKLESIGQLAAGIAHEINTPTQYVGDNTRFLKEAFGNLHQLLEKYSNLFEAAKGDALTKDHIRELEKAVEEADLAYLNKETPKAIQQTLEGVEHVTKIVRSLKEFSHPGSKEMTATDINKALENTITVSRNEWKYVAEMETDFDPSLPLVPCMPGELNQVFLNMIINAAHAITDVVGDGSNGKKGTIKISTKDNGNSVEIRISDTGTGIPEDIRSRIFDPFFTTKQVGKGTGQGLTISHSVIVEKHGGSVSLDTKMGEGTIFIIQLPIHREDTKKGEKQ